MSLSLPTNLTFHIMPVKHSMQITKYEIGLKALKYILPLYYFHCPDKIDAFLLTLRQEAR